MLTDVNEWDFHGPWNNFTATWEKMWQTGKRPYSQYTSGDCKKLHTTRSRGRLDHSACRRVCIQQVSWLIANKRGFRHHGCHMVSLPQICTAINHLNILHAFCMFLFHSSMACVSPHYLRYVQLSCYRMCRKTNHISFTCVFHMCILGQLHLLLHPEYWLGDWLVSQLDLPNLC